jgi:DNA-binding MarR family transcriptional regulator
MPLLTHTRLRAKPKTPSQPAHAPASTQADQSHPVPTAPATPSTLSDDRWRASHLGRWLGHAMRRFDARVLELMAHNENVRLSLANLAAREQVSAAHVHITRHLGLNGSRLTELAAQAGMSKQAMGTLVTQCEAWGLVRREPDALDARAKRVCFTPDGLAWLSAFQVAVTQAEDELKAAVGEEVAAVIAIGLEAYASA